MFISIGHSICPGGDVPAKLPGQLVSSITSQISPDAPTSQPFTQVGKHQGCYGGKTNVLAVAPELWSRIPRDYPALAILFAKLDQHSIAPLVTEDRTALHVASLDAFARGDRASDQVLQWFIYWTNWAASHFSQSAAIGVLDMERAETVLLQQFATDIALASIEQ